MNFDHLDPDEVYTSERSIPEALLRAAWRWAQDRSKDPRTKVGAVVYDPRTGASFYGYNGFNSGMPDFKEVWDCRDEAAMINKYNFVRHAEPNAIEKAMKLLGDLNGCYLVVTHLPCPACMKDWIVPSGIKRVYFNDVHDENPLTFIHAKRHDIDLIQIESPGVGKGWVFLGHTSTTTTTPQSRPHNLPEFYSDRLAEPYVAEVDKDAETAVITPSPGPKPSRDKKSLWVTQHAVDQLRERFSDEVSGTDSDLRRLLFGMFYNGAEVGERVVDTAFVRTAYFNSGRAIALSCKDEGARYVVVTVLYVEELDETGLIRFPEQTDG